ncbi:hypothetical protein D3C81_2121570 [compost metagenome]
MADYFFAFTVTMFSYFIDAAFENCGCLLQAELAERKLSGMKVRRSYVAVHKVNEVVDVVGRLCVVS